MTVEDLVAFEAATLARHARELEAIAKFKRMVANGNGVGRAVFVPTQEAPEPDGPRNLNEHDGGPRETSELTTLGRAWIATQLGGWFTAHALYLGCKAVGDERQKLSSMLLNLERQGYLKSEGGGRGKRYAATEEFSADKRRELDEQSAEIESHPNTPAWRMRDQIASEIAAKRKEDDPYE
jgi:hypothetical protein